MKIKKEGIYADGLFSIRDGEGEPRLVIEKNKIVMIYSSLTGRGIDVRISFPILCPVGSLAGEIGIKYDYYKDVTPYSLNINSFEHTGNPNQKTGGDAIRAYYEAQAKPESRDDVILSFFLKKNGSPYAEWVALSEQNIEILFGLNKVFKKHNF